MMMFLLGTYLTLSLGAGFLMWAMCRMASQDLWAHERGLELRIEAEPMDTDGMIAPSAIAY
jgi:hypothetical protein